MRVNLTLDEALKDDLSIVANITGRTIGDLLDSAVAETIGKQDERIKLVVEAARKARASK